MEDICPVLSCPVLLKSPPTPTPTGLSSHLGPRDMARRRSSKSDVPLPTQHGPPRGTDQLGFIRTA